MKIFVIFGFLVAAYGAPMPQSFDTRIPGREESRSDSDRRVPARGSQLNTADTPILPIYRRERPDGESAAARRGETSGEVVTSPTLTISDDGRNSRILNRDEPSEVIFPGDDIQDFPSADQRSHQAPIVVRDERNSNASSFSYVVDQSDGTYEERYGQVGTHGGIVMEGSYGYYTDDGTPIVVTYVADEDGFQPQSAIIPTPPPLTPEARAQIYFADYMKRNNLKVNSNGVWAFQGTNDPVQNTGQIYNDFINSLRQGYVYENGELIKPDAPAGTRQ